MYLFNYLFYGETPLLDNRKMATEQVMKDKTHSRKLEIPIKNKNPSVHLVFLIGLLFLLSYLVIEVVKRGFVFRKMAEVTFGKVPQPQLIPENDRNNINNHRVSTNTHAEEEIT